MKKSEIREEYKGLRAQLSTDERAQKSAAVCEFLIKRTAEANLSSVHLFLPIQKFHELDLTVYINWLWSEEIQVVVPVSNMKTKEMSHVVYERGSELHVSSLGIPEPVSAVQADVGRIDMVIVPLLAIDQLYNRVGYGAGFYDAFFEALSSDVLKVGVGFFKPLKDAIEDVRSEDVPLDAYCDPKGFYFKG